MMLRCEIKEDSSRDLVHILRDRKSEREMGVGVGGEKGGRGEGEGESKIGRS